MKDIITAIIGVSGMVLAVIILVAFIGACVGIAWWCADVVMELMP